MADIGLFEAMATCRTIRRFRPDPVPDELLRRVLTAATWAPSGGNRQPWRFVVVRDPARKKTLQELYLPLWERFSAAYTARFADESPASRRMPGAADHLAHHLD